MRGVVVVVLVCAAVVVACGLGRGRGDAEVYAWVGLACLAVGAGVGAAYARARRGWVDYRVTRRQVPVLRRAFVGQAGRLLWWGLMVAALAWLAVAGLRAGR